MTNTLSGKGTSHDTVMVLFQNIPKSDNESGRYNTQIPKLPEKLPCRKNFNSVTTSQQVVAILPRFQRGTISPEFFMKEYNKEICSKHIDTDFELCILSRWIVRNSMESESDLIFDKPNFKPTTVLPYSAAEMRTICTAMINFQDVLKSNKIKNMVVYDPTKVGGN